MVEPPLLFDVLGVAAAFSVLDDVVVFLQLKFGDFPGLFVQIRRPAENRLREGRRVDRIFGQDERDKESRFIDDDGPSAAEALVDGDVLFFYMIQIETSRRIAGDPHDDGAGRSEIDDAKVPVIGAKERFFELKLLEDRNALKRKEVERFTCWNRRSPKFLQWAQ